MASLLPSLHASNFRKVVRSRLRRSSVRGNAQNQKKKHTHHRAKSATVFNTGNEVSAKHSKSEYSTLPRNLGDGQIAGDLRSSRSAEDSVAHHVAGRPPLDTRGDLLGVNARIHNENDGLQESTSCTESDASTGEDEVDGPISPLTGQEHVSQQVEELCRRKLCSALFARDEYFLTSCQTSTVHIFALATSGSLGKGWMHWPQYKVNPKKVQLILTFHPDAQQSNEIERNKENISLSTSNGRLPVTKDTVSNSTADNSTSNTERDSAVPVNDCHKRGSNLMCENDTVHSAHRLFETTAGDLKQEVTDIDKSQGIGETSNSTEDLLSKQLDESLNLKCDSASPRVWYKAVVFYKGCQVLTRT